MIKHPKLLQAALWLLGASMVTRQAWSYIAPVSFGADVPGVELVVLLGILLAGASFFDFEAIRPGKKVRAARDFKPESPAQMAESLKAMCRLSSPDVPLIIDYIIYQAIAARASDIHFDPSRNGFAVRVRIDGLLTDLVNIPVSLSHPIANRLKVLSNLVVYQGFLPQDGRIGPDRDETSEAADARARAADFRIAFMPTLHGERIVIRILGKTAKGQGFVELGMSELQERLLRQLIARPQGMIIFTGPTGSGKTTTIYASLRAIQETSKGARSIATLEDPIEYEIPGINQSQVDEPKSFTFDKGLRALLRQDPDVIMVGEIRDPETGAIAIQAGMTGHLIITTVHANSSAATFSRLLEMGLAPYSLNAAITAVIAQRLVRKLCASCRYPRQTTVNEKTSMNLEQNQEFTVFEARGCTGCEGSGYSGRLALYEILEVNENIRTLVGASSTPDVIYDAACRHGMRSLFEQAVEAALRGITTVDEVLRSVVSEK
ncbi:MAG: GspE/PulE family protein [Myxococcota bacterium]|jgi:type II secretory ATPase GspE/PulE/Tfp pilus assembly ATPase PilB-like protein|nr:GspE/PulE family protein [Myxococcota bacterium]